MSRGAQGQGRGAVPQKAHGGRRPHGAAARDAGVVRVQRCAGVLRPWHARVPELDCRVVALRPGRREGASCRGALCRGGVGSGPGQVAAPAERSQCLRGAARSLWERGRGAIALQALCQRCARACVRVGGRAPVCVCREREGFCACALVLESVGRMHSCQRLRWHTLAASCPWGCCALHCLLRRLARCARSAPGRRADYKFSPTRVAGPASAAAGHCEGATERLQGVGSPVTWGTLPALTCVPGSGRRGALHEGELS